MSGFVKMTSVFPCILCNVPVFTVTPLNGDGLTMHSHDPQVFCSRTCLQDYVMSERCKCSVNLEECDDSDPDYDDCMSDVEADADTLRSAGWGTDEDYGYYGDDGYI